MSRTIRNLILVLGDQLDHQSSVFDDFAPEQDAVWMAEVEEENTHVWCHKLRIAVFLSAMRHFRDDLKEQGIRVEYHELTTAPSHDKGKSHVEVLAKSIHHLHPRKLIVAYPGDDRVKTNLEKTSKDLDIELEIRPDQHFYCTPEEFAEYAKTRSGLLLENFYRHMRKTHHILVDKRGNPEGDQWNYDHDNRESFDKAGPPKISKRPRFEPDQITRDVFDLVEKRFAKHPGRLDHFDHPVTCNDAKKLLRHFINHLLESFGPFEDAMWTDEPFLYHSRLSLPLNLKLISPRECIEAAIKAYEDGKADLASVEGFVRQILGWREFIRGIYWLKMPQYQDLNALNQTRKLPSFFWDGETDMNCVHHVMNSILDYGYTHHIQRLMVMGNLAQTMGADPYQFHEWHMAMYVDAVDWVSLPNALGMSQFGDGGIVGTKPYCSTGNYINKMSNYCKVCRYDYKQKVGDDACPFSTFYWDFFDRHYDKLKSNQRLSFAIKNLEKMRQDQELMSGIRSRAKQLIEMWESGESSESSKKQRDLFS